MVNITNTLYSFYKKLVYKKVEVGIWERIRIRIRVRVRVRVGVGVRIRFRVRIRVRFNYYML